MWCCIYQTQQVTWYKIIPLAVCIPLAMKAFSINPVLCAQRVSIKPLKELSRGRPFLLSASSTSEKRNFYKLVFHLLEESSSEGPHQVVSLALKSPFHSSTAFLNWSFTRRGFYYSYERPISKHCRTGICRENSGVRMYWRYMIASEQLGSSSRSFYQQKSYNLMPKAAAYRSGDRLQYDFGEDLDSYKAMQALQPTKSIQRILVHRRHQSTPVIRSQSSRIEAAEDWLAAASWTELQEMSIPLRHRRKLRLCHHSTAGVSAYGQFRRLAPTGILGR